MNESMTQFNGTLGIQHLMHEGKGNENVIEKVTYRMRFDLAKEYYRYSQIENR